MIDKKNNYEKTYKPVLEKFKKIKDKQKKLEEKSINDKKSFYKLMMEELM